VGREPARSAERGRGRQQQDTVSLHEPLEAAIAAARTGSAERRTIIEYRAPDLPVQVFGDAGALQQLFLNLLLNATEAAGEDGRVDVALTLEQDDAVIDIRDNGPGIPDELRQRVFDPLFTTRREGTGLGLVIAERIARAHGGSIELTGAPGGGTTARVRLPRVAPAVTSPTANRL